jgi:hypothetical protein
VKGQGVIVSTLPVRRRTRAERIVLAYLRGDRCARRNDLELRFHRLRQIAARSGLEVMAPGSAYVSQSELTLLCWIAAAQRMAAPMSMPDNQCLAEIVRRCAEALDAADLRLPPITMYISRFRDAGAA